MNKLSTKVAVPTSREIMGSGKPSSKPEAPVDYEQALDGVSFSDDILVCGALIFAAVVCAGGGPIECYT